MSSPGIGRGLLIVAAVVVAVTVIAALRVTGGPSGQRIARLDERRVSDLQRIQSAIEDHAHQRGSLPGTLEGLALKTHRNLVLADPESGVAYGYEPLAQGRYRLCAEFGADNLAPAAYAADASGGWQHPAGRQCFERRLPAEIKLQGEGAGSG